MNRSFFNFFVIFSIVVALITILFLRIDLQNKYLLIALIVVFPLFYYIYMRTTEASKKEKRKRCILRLQLPKSIVAPKKEIINPFKSFMVSLHHRFNIRLPRLILKAETPLEDSDEPGEALPPQNIALSEKPPDSLKPADETLEIKFDQHLYQIPYRSNSVIIMDKEALPLQNIQTHSVFDPVTEQEWRWVDKGYLPELKKKNIGFMDLPRWLGSLLKRVVWRHLEELLPFLDFVKTLQENGILPYLEKTAFSAFKLYSIFKDLMKEGVAYTNLLRIIEILDTTFPQPEFNLEKYVETILVRLRESLMDKVADPKRKIQAFILDPRLEEQLCHDWSDPQEGLSHALIQETISSIYHQPVWPEVILTDPSLRYHFKRAIFDDFPETAVISSQLLPRGYQLEIIGTIPAGKRP